MDGPSRPICRRAVMEPAGRRLCPHATRDQRGRGRRFLGAGTPQWQPVDYAIRYHSAMELEDTR
jgi:hypothetical protein